MADADGQIRVMGNSMSRKWSATKSFFSDDVTSTAMISYHADGGGGKQRIFPASRVIEAIRITLKN